jgi:rhodanese-related sulfurtransferase
MLSARLLGVRVCGGVGGAARRGPGLAHGLAQWRSVTSVGAVDFMQAIKTRPRAEFQVVDVRETSELEQASLKNTLEVVNLPLSDMNRWRSELSTHLDDSKTTYCLCRSGTRSMGMAQYLEKVCGFKDVVNISGGITAIAEEVDPSVGTPS